jgi:hypothetical protein
LVLRSVADVFCAFSCRFSRNSYTSSNAAHVLLQMLAGGTLRRPVLFVQALSVGPVHPADTQR